MLKSYFILAFAIACEVIATTALVRSEGFTKLVPTLIMAVGYGIAFYCLSIVSKTIPIGITYALWSGLGIVLISFMGWIYLNQRLDLPAQIGIAFIIIGVLVINLFSKSVSH